MREASAQGIASAFIAACLDELEAPKPGNVHRYADGHRMTAQDFVRSAEAAAPTLTAASAPVGARILGAVEASLAIVGTNTNLGIILLCAPLAAAAEMGEADLQRALVTVLGGLDRQDAARAFRAIAIAAPAGLGRSERHDVFAPAEVTLRDAMEEAAGRDRIARQYVTDFADVFGVGLARFDAALATTSDRRWSTLLTYLNFLSSFPDSHILRKYGPDIAERVRRRAVDWEAGAESDADWELLLPKLLQWDSELKEAGINPGTSADLTVATLFVDRLRSVLPGARNSD